MLVESGVPGSLRRVAAVETDDRGEYRVGALLPGTYFVAVALTVLAARPPTTTLVTAGLPDRHYYLDSGSRRTQHRCRSVPGRCAAVSI